MTPRRARCTYGPFDQLACREIADPAPISSRAQVGGYGPDTYDYYYTATYMDEVRKNCPASCDVYSDMCASAGRRKLRAASGTLEQAH